MKLKGQHEGTCFLYADHINSTCDLCPQTIYNRSSPSKRSLLSPRQSPASEKLQNKKLLRSSRTRLFLVANFDEIWGSYQFYLFFLRCRSIHKAVYHAPFLHMLACDPMVLGSFSVSFVERPLPNSISLETSCILETKKKRKTARALDCR